MKKKTYTLSTFKKETSKMRGFWCCKDEYIVSLLDTDGDFAKFGIARGYIKSINNNNRCELYWTDKGYTELVEPHKNGEKWR